MPSRKIKELDVEVVFNIKPQPKYETVPFILIPSKVNWRTIYKEQGMEKRTMEISEDVIKFNTLPIGKFFVPNKVQATELESFQLVCMKVTKTEFVSFKAGYADMAHHVATQERVKTSSAAKIRKAWWKEEEQEPTPEPPKPLTLEDCLPSSVNNREQAANENGGLASVTPFRFDLSAPDAEFVKAAILGEGAKTHPAWNWRSLTVDENLNHAQAHIMAYQAGDTGSLHLGHAYVRMMFALDIWIIETKAGIR